MQIFRLIKLSCSFIFLAIDKDDKDDKDRKINNFPKWEIMLSLGFKLGFY
jgi:hypothetical protein